MYFSPIEVPADDVVAGKAQATKPRSRLLTQEVRAKATFFSAIAAALLAACSTQPQRFASGEEVEAAVRHAEQELASVRHKS
ncbi:MAG TPA: hypothetical protein VGD10_02360 [Allosphingosinicella sp.]|uniref:hypothetical protein n=1 Tax=Allosphingosinicella sp. TaxID=2823234 RepID=UPI002EDB5D91